MATKKKSGSKNLTRILISIIFLALGTSSVISTFQDLVTSSLQDLLTLNLNLSIATVLGVLMFVTGIISFCGKMVACRVLGVIICILSVVLFVLSLPSCTLSTLQGPALYLTQALLAWLFFDLS